MRNLKHVFMAGLLTLGMAGGRVAAQNQTAPAVDPHAAANPALKSGGGMSGAPLASGQNSFTRAQARARIRRAGYSHVHDLKQDGAGLWQAHAKHDGAYVDVALDYKGDVATR